MAKIEYLIIPKGTKFMRSGKLGLRLSVSTYAILVDGAGLAIIFTLPFTIVTVFLVK